MNLKVNPKMIVLARQARGYTQSDLARLIPTFQSHMSKIEFGDFPVKDNVIKRLEEILKFPKEFFFNTQ